MICGLSSKGVSDDLEWPSRSFVQWKHFQMRFFIHKCSSWQLFPTGLKRRALTLRQLSLLLNYTQYVHFVNVYLRKFGNENENIMYRTLFSLFMFLIQHWGRCYVYVQIQMQYTCYCFVQYKKTRSRNQDIGCYHVLLLARTLRIPRHESKSSKTIDSSRQLIMA